MRPLLLCLFLPLVSAQTFEGASVRIAGPQSRRNFDGGPGSLNPELYTANSARLRDLLANAYGLTEEPQISGPGWIESDLYDVSAKVPPGTSKEQFQTMLQNLLAERFHLKVHRETKMLSVYELTVAKNGSKIKPSAAASGAGEPRSGDVDRDGFPALPPGVATAAQRNTSDGLSKLVAQQQPISTLVTMIHSAAGRPIVDKTGLSGLYDFKLAYDWRATSSNTPTEAGAPDLFVAMEEQLGLKLVDAKAAFDVIVVDSGGKAPVEN
jgi:uncharacterized protein (TIGR03435 family)